MDMSGQASSPGRFTPTNNPCSWVGFRKGLDVSEKTKSLCVLVSVEYYYSWVRLGTYRVFHDLWTLLKEVIS